MVRRGSHCALPLQSLVREHVRLPYHAPLFRFLQHLLLPLCSLHLVVHVNICINFLRAVCCEFLCVTKSWYMHSKETWFPAKKNVSGVSWHTSTSALLTSVARCAGGTLGPASRARSAAVPWIWLSRMPPERTLVTLAPARFREVGARTSPLTTAARHTAARSSSGQHGHQYPWSCRFAERR